MAHESRTAPVPLRVAFVVSHPIQYYVPMYQRLARRDDIELKVFFTWHDAAAPVFDSGFGQAVRWDLPLTEGYEHVAVANTASRPGTSSFFGLRNPGLVRAVLEWGPDVVHITGWAWWSHLEAIRALSHLRIPVVFRGDSHLLDGRGPAWRWQAKRAVLGHVFRWPTLFLTTGRANEEYYRAFGVPAGKLRRCPHSIDVSRFAQPHDSYEEEAQRWRRELGFKPEDTVVLFAGKFEPKKRPLHLMHKILEDSPYSMVVVGAGVLEDEVRLLSSRHAGRCVVLPFQNQGRMPAVYRLGDVFVLPSSFGETWGLAVCEALACGRPVVVSDRVGCASEVVAGASGKVFPWNNLSAMISAVDEMIGPDAQAARLDARQRAWEFDISAAEPALVAALQEAARET